MKKVFALTAITVAAMLERPEREYNQSVWKEKVNRYAKNPKCQFYVIEKENNGAFEYARFFVSYVADGIYFFSEFSGFSSSITSRGFVKAFVIDNVLYKQYFWEGTENEGAIANNKEARQWIRENLTSRNIMVSSCI